MDSLKKGLRTIKAKQTSKQPRSSSDNKGGGRFAGRSISSRSRSGVKDYTGDIPLVPEDRQPDGHRGLAAGRPGSKPSLWL